MWICNRAPTSPIIPTIGSGNPRRCHPTFMDFRRSASVAIVLLFLSLAVPARAAGFGDYVASPFRTFVLAIESAVSQLVAIVEPHRALTVQIPPAPRQSSPSSATAAPPPPRYLTPRSPTRQPAIDTATSTHLPQTARRCTVQPDDEPHAVTDPGTPAPISVLTAYVAPPTRTVIIGATASKPIPTATSTAATSPQEWATTATSTSE
jgi:hypothetical protein